MFVNLHEVLVERPKLCNYSLVEKYTKLARGSGVDVEWSIPPSLCSRVLVSNVGSEVRVERDKQELGCLMLIFQGNEWLLGCDS